MDHATMAAKEDATHTFHIGDSVIASTMPTIEGMVLDVRKREDNKNDLLLLVALYHKKGFAWIKATVCYKEASKLFKRSAALCMCGIPNIEKWREEAKRVHACPIWITSALEELNAKIPNVTLIQQKKVDSTRDPYVATTPANGDTTATSSCSPVSVANTETDELEQRIKDIMQLTRQPKKQARRKSRKLALSTSSSSSQEEKTPAKAKKNRITRRHRTRSSSSSASSSSSSSDESVAPGEVGEKGKSGMFSCPFASTDCRGFKDVKIVVKGQAISRRHIRTALHNLYADNYSMAAFVNNIITTVNASTYKPFPSDAAWLLMHAKYLDGVLLNALDGPWALWNEAWLDDLAAAFLELVVRVSATKEYPPCLDDKVRKWMKKRRVGVNTKYGPISAGMQQAKITENGLQFFPAYKQGFKDNRNPRPLPVPTKPTGVAGAMDIKSK